MLILTIIKTHDSMRYIRIMSSFLSNSGNVIFDVHIEAKNESYSQSYPQFCGYLHFRKLVTF
ncbi:MAG: hypothetical protein RLZZ59_803 [Pseudomonadota bacterium]|jgi:hypothetical protein